MRRAFQLTVCCLLACAALAACQPSSSKPSTRKGEEREASGGSRAARTFTKPVPPTVCTDEAARQEYTALHWWDAFDFRNTAWLAGADSVLLEQTFADYLGALRHTPETVKQQSVRAMLRKAADGTSPVFRHFMHLTEHYLYEAGSPLRDDALYLAAAEYLLTSPAVDTLTRSSLETYAAMLRKNLPGTVAADFDYITSGGTRSRLHRVKAEHTLLFFYDPDCDVCAHDRNRLAASPAVHRQIAAGKLKILAVYPDADLESWRRHAPEMPDGWITARDESGRITTGGLYDLRGLPSLYLLDSRKRVVLKDASAEQVVNELERQRTNLSNKQRTNR